MKDKTHMRSIVILLCIILSFILKYYNFNIFLFPTIKYNLSLQFHIFFDKLNVDIFKKKWKCDIEKSMLPNTYFIPNSQMVHTLHHTIYKVMWLFRAGLKTLPHNAKMHYNWANYQRDVGDTQTAVNHYREALR